MQNRKIMAETDKYGREKLIHHLETLGVKREDVEEIIKDYSRNIEKEAYNMGVRHYKRINKLCRIYSRDLAKKEWDELYYEIVQNYPVELADKVLSIGYSHLPYVG